jgi:hypothetical protein
MSSTPASTQADEATPSRHATSTPSIRAVLAVATLPALALAPRWLRGPGHFAWDVGDTAGTMAYVRALCIEPSTSRVNDLLNYPFGFDNSAYPFWNLIDTFRVNLASIFGCTTNSLAIIFALTPLVAMIGNCVTGFLFGFSISRNNLDGAIIAVFGIFSPALLLQTRTSLSNNVLFFGLLALTALVLYLRALQAHWLVTYFFFLTAQIWTNVYTGAGFILLSQIVLLSHAAAHSKGRRGRLPLSSIAATFLSIVVGLAPLLRSQWFLLSGNSLSHYARPSRTELVGLTEVLLSPNLATFGSLLSILSIVIVAATRRAKLRTMFPFLGVLLILSLSLDLPWLGPLQWLYHRLLGPLRGIGYFNQFVPFLLALNLVQVLPKLQMVGIQSSRRRLHFVVPVLILDALTSIPRAGIQVDPTFTRAVALQDVAAPFPVDLPVNSVVLQLPDYYYSGTERLFGAPGREILIDQMFHGRPMINGRDFITALRNCVEVYSPEALIDLKALAARGGNIVALRLNDLPGYQASRLREQLVSENWQPMPLQTGDSSIDLELWRAPSAPKVDLPSACGRPS